MNLRESFNEITPADRKIRHDPWPATLQNVYIYIYILKRASFNFRAKARVERSACQRERERTPRGGTLTLDNPPLHGPPTPLRNCVRARYQLAESNLVFREGWDDWFTENEWPHCQTSLFNLGIRLPRREREGETLDFDDSRLDWIVSNRFRSSFRGFLIFRY